MLSNLSDEKRIWEEIETKIRTDIRKATNRYNLKIRDDLGIEDFLNLHRKTFFRQGKELPHTEDLVRRIDRACTEHNCRKIWIAEDGNGRHHAGAYVVWDENSAYYLMGGGDSELRNSGATSQVLWEAIKHASTVTQKFDFEGSMIESIERFFRAFGGRQELIFNITKTNSKLLKLRQFLLNIMGKE